MSNCEASGPRMNPTLALPGQILVRPCKSPTSFLMKLNLFSTVNPLSPDSDQHQFSPKDIRTLSRD